MTKKASRLRLDEILVKEGIISDEQIKEALSRQKERGGKFGSQLLLHGYIDEAGLVKALATQFNCDGVVLSKLDIPEIILKFIPRRLAIARKIIPFDYDLENNVLKIACEDPNDKSLLNEINFVARGKDIKLYVASELALNTAIAKFYMGRDTSKDGGLLLELPRETGDTGKLPTTEVKKPAEAITGKPDDRTILVVVDDSEEGAAIQNLLKRDGYSVVIVDSADDALELVGGQRFQSVIIKDTVSGDYLDLIDRLRKLTPSTTVRYFSSVSSLLLIDEVYGQEAGLLYQDLELFTCLLAARDGLSDNRAATVGLYADKLCQRLELPHKDRLTIVNAAYIHELARHYYRVGDSLERRQIVKLTATLLESLDYSPGAGCHPP